MGATTERSERHLSTRSGPGADAKADPPCNIHSSSADGGNVSVKDSASRRSPNPLVASGGDAGPVEQSGRRPANVGGRASPGGGRSPGGATSNVNVAKKRGLDKSRSSNRIL